MELKFSDQQKVNYVRIIAIVSTLILMLYAPKLWLTEKVFPVVSLFDWIPIPTGFFDYAFWVLLFGSQLIYIFYNKRWLGWLVVLLYVYLSLVDQNRLQPYFYQSFLTIFAIVLFPKNTDNKKILYAIILIFFATYFWSGVQKVNETFYIQWLGALNKHFSFLPQWFLQYFTYAVPWLEASMGVLILFNKTRRFGLYFILSMHAIIVAILIYLGYGYNVIPWNIQNIASTIIIFWSLETNHPLDFFKYKLDKQKAVMLFMVIALPIGNNLFGVYDKLLSFHFFTADLNYYNVYIGNDLKEKLPSHIQQFYRTDKKGLYVQVNEWAQKDNKVLFHPERRSILYIDKYLRSFADNPNQKDLTVLFDYNQNRE